MSSSSCERGLTCTVVIFSEYYIPDLAPIDPILDRVKFLQSRRTELEIMKRQVTQITDGHAVFTEAPSCSENSSSFGFHGLNGASIEGQVEPQESSIRDDLIQLSSESMVPASPPQTSSCVYVPISSDLSHNEHPDSCSVNYQPDLLEDLLSFVSEAAAPNDIDTQNLPDLDDLAIDSVESESPEALSPTHS